MKTLLEKVFEMWELSFKAVKEEKVSYSYKAVALEKIISNISNKVKENHIKRLQDGKCTFKSGVILLEILSNIERIAGHLSNVAGYIIDISINNMNSHENLEEHIENNEIYKDYLLKNKGI